MMLTFPENGTLNVITQDPDYNSWSVDLKYFQKYDIASYQKVELMLIYKNIKTSFFIVLVRYHRPSICNVSMQFEQKCKNCMLKKKTPQRIFKQASL